jgi:hypothetical protein
MHGKTTIKKVTIQVTQDSQCTYNVTRGAFVQPLLQWRSNKYYISRVCVCSLRYPACNAHAPFCNMWPVWLYNSLPHYLINGTHFEKVLLKTECVFWFCPSVSSDTFLFPRRSEWNIIEHVHWSSCRVSVILVRF